MTSPLTNHQVDLASVETVQEDGHIRVKVLGEIDISTTDVFEDAIDKAIRHRCGLVIDLRKTRFVAACALRPILRASRALQSDRDGVTVLISSETQRRLFTATGVDAFVTIEEDPGD
jgi:anti-anti-sigma factor